MLTIDEIWNKIIKNEDEIFQLKTKGEMFTYKVEKKFLRIIRNGRKIKQKIYARNFEKAMSKVPLDKPSDIKDLVQGPSYVYAIIMDDRIKANHW